jgi:peptidoglycan/xylan/chitin deacetylase (PgdA/CDA1 family)
VTVCFTVDVEDWYDGIAELGYRTIRADGESSGLEGLHDILSRTPTRAAPRITLFVVGKYVPEVRESLRELANEGHELASHGPDHGWPPEDPGALEDWLRRGREMVEEAVETPVVGFRSPRFDLPGSMSLERYREVLARAGYTYVSDRHRLGPGSPVGELPVFQWRGLPLGGGSYQRLLPKQSLRPLLREAGGPAVLYYHSYDFGVTLPPVSSARSLGVLKQVVARSRIPKIFGHLLQSFGSVPCREVAHGV